jgi:hypothetical protein
MITEYILPRRLFKVHDFRLFAIKKFIQFGGAGDIRLSPQTISHSFERIDSSTSISNRQISSSQYEQNCNAIVECDENIPIDIPQAILSIFVFFKDRHKKSMIVGLGTKAQQIDLQPSEPKLKLFRS